MQMVKGIAPRARYAMFNIPSCVQDVQSMIITGTNYGTSVRAGLNIPLLYICFNMHCFMAATMTTNMAFQLQPPSSVGGSPQGAGETWVLNWFVWLYFKCRTPTDVYNEGCFWRASQSSVSYTHNRCVVRLHWIFFTATRLRYNEQAEHSASLEFKPTNGKWPHHSLK